VEGEAGFGRPKLTWKRVGRKGEEAEESNTSRSSELAGMAKSD